MSAYQFIGILMVAIPIIAGIAVLIREGCLVEVLLPMLATMAIAAFITTGIFLAMGALG